MLGTLPVPAEADRWPWSRPAAGDDHMAAVPGLAAAVAEAVAAARAAVTRGRLTLGLLHTDPAPTAFRVDARGRVGVIDWGQAVWGPLLYDVGSAVVLQRLGDHDGHREAFAVAYRRTAPVSPGELAALETLVRLRWAVQAWWFSWRLASGDHLGLEDPTGNQRGLARATEALGVRYGR